MISDSSEAIANSNYDSSKQTILYIPGLSDASSDAASQLPGSKFSSNFISNDFTNVC